MIPHQHYKCRSLRIICCEDIQKNKWVDLGNTNTSGDLSSGTITSINFVPDEYEALTLASYEESDDTTQQNYYISPSLEDGYNDAVVIDGTLLRPDNKLEIYNRWGRLVYEKKGYDNTFRGEANVKNVIERSKRLPTGTYYYVFNYYDRGKEEYVGWIYIQ